MWTRHTALAPLMSLAAAACLALASQATSAGDMLQVEIVSVAVEANNAAICQDRWTATVRNIGTVPVSSSRILGLQAYGSRTATGMEWPASGGSLTSLGTGATGSFSITFERDPRATLLNVFAYDGSTRITQRTITLAAPPALSIANFTRTATAWGYDAVNSSTMGAKAIRQAYKSRPTDPPQWVGAGGMTVCFPPGNTHYTGTPDAEFPLIKIQLIQGDRTEEKIFDTRPPAKTPKFPVRPI